MIDEKELMEKINEMIYRAEMHSAVYYALCEVIEFIEHQRKEGEWIPCSERLPKCEEEVWIITDRGTTTTAIYEDGTILDRDSMWNWIDIDGKWDDENDCMIIPEGWWEDRHFNPDEVYNNVIDEKVIAWQPLPEPWEGEEVKDND